MKCISIPSNQSNCKSISFTLPTFLNFTFYTSVFFIFFYFGLLFCVIIFFTSFFYYFLFSFIYFFFTIHVNSLLSFNRRRKKKQITAGLLSAHRVPCVGKMVNAHMDLRKLKKKKTHKIFFDCSLSLSVSVYRLPINFSAAFYIVYINRWYIRQHIGFLR